MSHLPPDLVEEILSRVPVTSLARLRTTSKRWNALFKDRRFTEKHSREAAKESLVLVLKESRLFLMSVSPNVVDPSREFKVPLGLKDSHSNVEQVRILEPFHCGGLLLCPTNHHKLLVWNPCLAETRWIQLPKKTDDHNGLSMFSLGYENNQNCHSYKILRCYQNRLAGSDLYEFSSDSWRVLDAVAPPSCIDSSMSVSLKGNAYWLASGSDDGISISKYVLSFDFTRERFRRFCLPAFQSIGWMILSEFREERLSLLHRSYGFDASTKMDIWVTNNIDFFLSFSNSSLLL